jgi:hypothetical protein
MLEPAPRISEDADEIIAKIRETLDDCGYPASTPIEQQGNCLYFLGDSIGVLTISLLRSVCFMSMVYILLTADFRMLCSTSWFALAPIHGILYETT